MQIETFSEEGFIPMFDGKTLNGWSTTPRILCKVHPNGPPIQDLLEKYGLKIPPEPEKHPAHWYVQDDGVIVGEQAKKDYGGYLVSDDKFGEFELAFDANPDWPADTGVIMRRAKTEMQGIQVLIDHRKSGNIGGIFGGGLASVHARNYTLDVEKDKTGRPIGLKLENPADPSSSKEPLSQKNIDILSYGCNPEDFIKVWKWQDWNSFRIRVVGGPLPTVTTWVNGLKVSELNLATVEWPDFDPEAIANLLGAKGHIAFEVHDNDSHLGQDRWGENANCRWRNVRIKDLSGSSIKI
jgi:hypothetical protein